jgi:hypothetical protein
MLVLLWTTCLWVAAAQAGLPLDDRRWVSDATETPRVTLYFFWSRRCPHCRQARPYVESLPEKHPWIRLHSLELADHPENRQRFLDLSLLLDTPPKSVPTFMWCGKSHTGYASDQSTGQYLLDALAECYRAHYGEAPPGILPVVGPATDLHIETPWLGKLDATQYSLPVLTVVLGALDAFNPCAFFVLLFLLSLLVNTRSRGRMALVGGVFVLTSGLVYFAFMAAWLNLFHLLSGIGVVTTAAGLLAVVFGLLNIKSYYLPQAGNSLGISNRHREQIFERVRRLLNAQHLPTLLLGTLLLALAANSYELLCTLGLPMVFTRILTLEQLPMLHYYGYLALYNLVYVTPLAIIVGLFAATMGRRKLSNSEGRFLKLLSGHMMAGLGLLLLFTPDRLNQPLWAAMLIAVAVAATLLTHRLTKRP